MLIDDYLEAFGRLRARYGPDCKLVLLFMVGSFYEMYATVNDPATDPTSLYAVADLLNISVTRKNKSVAEVSRSNPLLAGIPVAALAKYRPVLLNADYTVAIANQRDGPMGGFVREVDEVLSPGTWTDENANDAGGRGTLLAVAWVDVRAGWTGVGLAGIDLTTGAGSFAEVNVAGPDAERALDEARCLLRAARPRELVVVYAGDGAGAAFGTAPKAVLARLLGCGGGGEAGLGLVHAAWRPPPEMARLAYQEAVIGKAFPAEARGLLGPVEYLGLERSPLAAAAYATVLDFSYSHDERVVARLGVPEPWTSGADNSVSVHNFEQLNVVGGSKSLLSLLNVCKTAFGRRAFASRLLRPTRDIDELERRLDAVEALLVPTVEGGEEKAVPAYESARAALSGVHDLERLARRIALARALPHEVAALADSAARACSACTAEGAIASGATLAKAFEGWDIEMMRRGDLGVTALNGAHAALVKLARERAESTAEVARLVTDTEARDDLTTTRRRFDAAVASGRVPGLEGREASGGRVRLAGPAIERLDIASRALEAANRAALSRLMEHLSGEACAAAMRAIVRATAELDISAAVADAAARHRYVRPTFLRSASGTCPARLRAVALRHPIVERLLTEEPYTANDVDLDGSGLLVYGLNASGKTTLMKALGCATIMAQAGMYVAGDALELRPFDAVYTRITGGDDLFSGQSSFVVEMAELRSILRRATNASLVLGDELACTTEHVSALAIVAQGVVTLAERGCCFVLTSHLHELTATKPVRALLDTARLRVAHVHVSVDPNGDLVFDRHLREGQGGSLYGLEVARALGLSEAFMAGADAVRRELLGVPEHLVAPRASRYNAKVFVDVCFLCGAVADEVHHLREQADADADGWFASAGGVGAHHKDAKFNLVAVCAACHDKQHAHAKRGETVKKTVKTTRGRRLGAI